MFWRQITILAIFLIQGLMPFSALAENDCAPVDIREGMPEDLNFYFKYPKDQNDTNFCAAHVFADLLSAELGKPVSPYDAAITHAVRVWEAPDEGVNLQTGTNSLLVGGPGVANLNDIFIGLQDRGKGICSFEAMPSAMHTNSNRVGKFEKELKELYEIRKRMRNKEDYLDLLIERDCKFEIQKRIDFPVLEMLKILEKSLSTSFNQGYAEIVDSACKENRISVPNNIMAVSTDAYIDDFVDSYLLQGKPVGVSMEFKYLGHNPESTGLHEMTVIARKKINNECYYQIRNSWGLGCDGYNEKLAKTCNIKDGTFMLTREQLRNWVYGASALIRTVGKAPLEERAAEIKRRIKEANQNQD